MHSALQTKTFTHKQVLHFYPGMRFRMKVKREIIESKDEMRVQFNLKGFGYCPHVKPFLTLLCPNEAHSNTGQSCHDLIHCKLDSHLQFYFSAPTRDSGTQLAKGTNWIQSWTLQAKKKMSHPTQNRWNFVFCSFASSFLCHYAQPFPSFSIPLLFCCKASKSPSGRGQASQYRLAPLWGQVNLWRQWGRLGEVIIYLSIYLFWTILLN